jgi:hypothetical protein
VIYTADIHQEVEDAVEGTSGLSFVNDVTWLVEAPTIPQLMEKIEECVRLYQAWA